MTAALKKFNKPQEKFTPVIIECHFSVLSGRLRLTFGWMEKNEREYYKKWLDGYAYAKGWKLPLFNAIDQPKLELE